MYQYYLREEHGDDWGCWAVLIVTTMLLRVACAEAGATSVGIANAALAASMRKLGRGLRPCVRKCWGAGFVASAGARAATRE